MDEYICKVNNIPPETSKEALEEFFSKFGQLNYAKIDLEPVGCVSFKTEKERNDAIRVMDGKDFKGRILKVYEKGETPYINKHVPPIADELVPDSPRIWEKLEFGSDGADCASQQDDYICIVNNIPPETSNEALEEAFTAFGEVIYANIDFEPDTGKSMGVGSVSFKRKEEKYNAISRMDGKVFNGNILEVYEKDAPRQDYYKCIVSNIPVQTSEEALEDAFSIFGKVIDAKIHVDYRTRKSIQTGYVTFEEKKAMENAVLQMDGRLFKGEFLKVSPPFEGSLESDCASFQGSSESDCLSQQNDYTCIIDNISPEKSIENLQIIFAGIGEVIYEKFDFDPNTGKSMGVGTVSYRRKREMANAIFYMNGVVSDDGYILEVYEKNDHYKCIVSNIPVQTTKEALGEAFSNFGKVINAKIRMDGRTGKSIKAGYVTFEEKTAMENAVLHMDGSLFNGETIQVCGKYFSREFLKVNPCCERSWGSDFAIFDYYYK